VEQEVGGHLPGGPAQGEVVRASGRTRGRWPGRPPPSRLAPGRGRTPPPGARRTPGGSTAGPTGRAATSRGTAGRTAASPSPSPPRIRARRRRRPRRRRRRAPWRTRRGRRTAPRARGGAAELEGAADGGRGAWRWWRRAWARRRQGSQPAAAAASRRETVEFAPGGRRRGRNGARGRPGPAARGRWRGDRAWTCRATRGARRRCTGGWPTTRRRAGPRRSMRPPAGSSAARRGTPGPRREDTARAYRAAPDTARESMAMLSRTSTMLTSFPFLHGSEVWMESSFCSFFSAKKTLHFFLLVKSDHVLRSVHAVHESKQTACSFRRVFLAFLFRKILVHRWKRWCINKISWFLLHDYYGPRLLRY
jgi:hypothetical protein